ncbi:hypothetical protein NC652_004707 [Populus alba x Populus x berolinensis]|nr:hypothetical protein NC652_004707 [Populus alba x Populus x berolinensis]
MGLFASPSFASTFISDGVFESHASTGRNLLQTKKACPVNFEFSELYNHHKPMEGKLGLACPAHQPSEVAADNNGSQIIAWSEFPAHVLQLGSIDDAVVFLENSRKRTQLAKNAMISRLLDRGSCKTRLEKCLMTWQRKMASILECINNRIYKEWKHCIRGRWIHAYIDKTRVLMSTKTHYCISVDMYAKSGKH